MFFEPVRFSRKSIQKSAEKQLANGNYFHFDVPWDIMLKKNIIGDNKLFIGTDISEEPRYLDLIVSMSPENVEASIRLGHKTLLEKAV